VKIIKKIKIVINKNGKTSFSITVFYHAIYMTRKNSFFSIITLDHDEKNIWVFFLKKIKKIKVVGSGGSLFRL
jgi:hypothetical protein